MEKLNYDDLGELIAVVEKFHGHVCAGIIIGVRMTVSALRRLNITDPLGADNKKLIVFTEVDRCASESIMCLTGCRPGKRTMKIMDYGKMAATFVNLDTGKAVRLAKASQPGKEQSEKDLTTVPEEDLFRAQEVEVKLSPADLPGKPVRHVQCANCDESVIDGREVNVNGRILCKPCAAGHDYYTRIEDFL